MWLDLAVVYKNTGLAMFSDELRNISQSNAKAMIGFASLVFAFSLASALTMETRENGSWLVALTDTFVLARGIDTVLEVKAEFLLQSNFAPVFDKTRPSVAIPDHALAALDRLEELNIQYNLDYPGHHVASYERSIRALRDAIPLSYAEPASMTMAATRAVRIPEDFLNDIRNEKPLALVVLAHFCVFIDLCREHWCIGFWGRKVLRKILHILDPDWRLHIDWAIGQVLGSNMTTHTSFSLKTRRINFIRHH